MKPPLVMLLFLAVGTGIGPFTHPVARSGEKTPTTLTCPTGKPSRLDAHGDPLPAGAIARLGTVRLRHGHIISGVVFSGDGKSIIASDHYSGVHVWDAADGKEVRRFFANDRCQRLAISPDGRVLAVALGDLTVRLCDPTSGRELGQLPSDRDSITEVVFSYDSALLATRTGGKSVRVYDVATQKLLYTATFPANVGKVAFSSDGKLLACGTANGVCLWHLAERREVGRLRNDPGGKNFLYATSAPRGGAMAVWGYDDASIRLCNAHGDREIRRLHRDEDTNEKTTDPWGSAASTAVSFSPNGKILAASRDVGRIDLWDVESGKKLHTLAFDSSHRPSLLAFAPDGTRLASAGGDMRGGDNTVRVWDVTQGREILPRAGHGSPITSVAVAPNGTTIATAGQDGILYLWDGPSGTDLLRLKGHPSRRSMVQFSGDGRRLISWGSYREDGTLRIWDARTAEVVRRLELRTSEAWWETVSDDGKTAVSVEFKAKRVRFHDLTTGQVTSEIADDFHRPIALSPTGDQFIGLGGSLLNVSDRKEVLHVRGLYTRGRNVRFSSDGRTLVAAVVPESPLEIKTYASDPAAEEIAVFGQVEGKELRRFGRRGERFRGIEAIALSADGKTVVTVHDSEDIPDQQVITLWETETGRERGHFLGHRGKVFALAISANGRYVVSGGSDTTALVWDATRPRTRYDWARPESAAAHFKDLAGDHAERAYTAIWALVRAPKDAVAFLADQSSFFTATDVQQIRRWIRDLDSNKFADRERASQELGLILDEAEPHLKEARQGKSSAEAQRRVDLLLEKRSAGVSGKELQRLRVIEILEHIAHPGADAGPGPDATRLAAVGALKKLALGPPHGRPSQQAKATLERLAR